MLPEIFILALALILALLFCWGFKNLPKEEWQVLSCLPRVKKENGLWSGENLTYYGLFNAAAMVLAMGVFLMLLGSVAIPIAVSMPIIILMLSICVPASRVIALLVEKQANTSTIGGASFIGIIVPPCVVLLVNETLGAWMHFRVNLLVIYTAVSIAYTMGEGIGRLACISFGCCYGKPLAQCNPILRRIFEQRYFIFSGRTKKISYAHHLDGEKVIPVQALTCVLYTVSGLLGCYIFLKGFLLTAMIISLTVTYGWRFISEFLRADNRGGGHISAYQIMALIVMAYTFLLAVFLPLHTPIKPNLAVGLWSLWNPFVIFFIECLGIIIFLVTGRSQVTGSTINLFVVRENIHQ